MRKVQPIELTCKCGKKYIAYSKKACMCPNCKEIKKKEYSKAYWEMEKQTREKNNKVASVKPKSIPTPKKSMSEIMRELNKYNREHDKHLSYGQYVSMMDGGKIK